MSNPKELSVVSSWLEEKLKEHFVKKSQLAKSRWSMFARVEPKYTQFAPSHRPGVMSIQTAVSDFRFLDFKLESNSTKVRRPTAHQQFQSFGSNSHGDPEMASEANMFSSCSSKSKKEDPYKVQSSHVYVVYQETSQSVGKELRLQIELCHIEDMRSMEETISKYELALDEHQIDVYTRVFPFLKYWASYKNVTVTLHVPECFYGRCETQWHPREESEADDDDLDTDLIADHLFDDDILRKVGAGLQFFERERKRKERAQQGRQSSYRLLIIENVARQGYKQRAVRDSSTFMSLLNVEEALKALAEIHAVSWAYAQLSEKSLLETWPFLNNRLYLPYITERVVPGFAAMERLVQAYLIESKKESEEESAGIMTSLSKLSPHVKEILEGARHPRHVKCLLHQSTCFSNLLFKYSVLKKKDSGKKKKNEQQSTKKQNAEGGNDNQNNNNNNEQNMKGKRTSGQDEGDHKARREGLEKELSREVMIVNWRTAGVGSPLIDVALLLLTALPPKTRRAETTALLHIYWNTFRMYAQQFGLTLKRTFRELYDDYMGALLYTCVLITGNIAGAQYELDDEGMEVFIEAIKDLRREKVI